MQVNAISCHLMGGLGNQLFQIFTTVAYGIRHQRFVIFQYSDTLNTGKERPTYWNSFLSNLSMFTTKVYKSYTPYQFARYDESNFRYNEIPIFTQQEVMLNGYFQSYLYFEQEKNNIMSTIQISKHQTDIRAEYAEILTVNESTRLISMHFRLGDYKLNPHIHPIMPFEYYKNALTNILSKTSSMNVTEYNVLYFCEHEDNETVSLIINKLILDFPIVQFEKVNDKICDWHQLLIMSCCHDNIIANSSFSWWGGFFNKTENKTICYPSTWFGPGANHDVSTLFPPSWTKILL